MTRKRSQRRRVPDPTSLSTQPQRLDKLEDIANDNHRLVESGYRSIFEHARDAGKALLEAQRTVKQGCWKEWLERRFVASRETAYVYMRIARNWNHPEIKTARREGLGINSIQQFLRVLKGQPLDPRTQEKQISRSERRQRQRRAIMRQFGKKLDTLSDIESTVLADLSVDPVDKLLGKANRVIDSFWQKGYQGLKVVVTEVYGDNEYYDPQAEEKKRAIRRKGAEARRKKLRVEQEKRTPTQST